MEFESPSEAASWPEPPSVAPGLPEEALHGKALIKEVCRLIRAARSHWDAHHNGATRMIRRKALALYGRLSAEEREEVPQVLRVWLRYRSEKYYGPRKKKKRKPR
jgi:hypothetical protein